MFGGSQDNLHEFILYLYHMALETELKLLCYTAGLQQLRYLTSLEHAPSKVMRSLLSGLLAC